MYQEKTQSAVKYVYDVMKTLTKTQREIERLNNTEDMTLTICTWICGHEQMFVTQKGAYRAKLVIIVLRPSI